MVLAAFATAAPGIFVRPMPAGRCSFRPVVAARTQRCHFRRAAVVARQERDDDGIEFIRLESFMKVQGMAGTGGQAKMMIKDGLVSVNGEPEVRRGRKLRAGDVVLLDRERLVVEFTEGGEA